MSVSNSGDVSLEGASFSKCTAGEVRLPRPHTLASPAHARSHAIAAHGHGGTPSPHTDMGEAEEGTRTWGGEGATPSPKGRSGPTRPLPLADALPAYAFPPQLAQRGGGMFVENSGDVSLESASFVECTSGSQAVPRAPSTRGCTD